MAEELDLLVPQQMSLTPLPGLSFTEQQFLEDVVYAQENLATLLSCLDNLLPDFQRVDSPLQGSEACFPFLPRLAWSLIRSRPCSKALCSCRCIQKACARCSSRRVLGEEECRSAEFTASSTRLAPDLALVILPRLCSVAGPQRMRSSVGCGGGSLKLTEDVQSLRRPARSAQWQEDFTDRPACCPLASRVGRAGERTRC